eukprot:TRINITY_DN37_c0_g1_i1.p1 TRINITY_DN37_c0_g1~~TRINITY_DN37_c0_g1_i1.p1  ORF type:complete len:421 (-),score=82.87 TRINITY_DN37_c0_g1_i1:11-1273(-)
MFTVIVGSYDRLVYGWVVQPEKPEGFVVESKNGLQLAQIFEYPSHNGPITALASRNNLMASGGADDMIVTYDVNKRTENQRFTPPDNGGVTCIGFASGFLLNGCSDGDICLWRTSDWKCLLKCSGHKSAVNDLAVHPSGRTVISVARDKTFKMFNLLNGRCVFTMAIGFEGVKVKWAPDANHWAIAGVNKVCVYGVATGEIKCTIEDKRNILAIAWINDHLIAVGGESGVITIWDINTSQIIRTLEPFNNRVKDLSVVAKHSSNDSQDSDNNDNNAQIGCYLVGISSVGLLKIWDLDLQEPDALFTAATDARFTCLTCCNISSDVVSKRPKKKRRIFKKAQTKKIRFEDKTQKDIETQTQQETQPNQQKESSTTEQKVLKGILKKPDNKEATQKPQEGQNKIADKKSETKKNRKRKRGKK